MDSYRKLCTEFYDIDKPNAPEDAFAFYLSYAEAAKGPILEPMCGSGRFLIPLLERGFAIEGTDASPEMLQACRERCQQRNLTPTIYEQLLDQLDLPRQYALILIPAGSFSLITDLAKARESLKRLYSSLLPGGKLVMEVEQLKAHTSSNWPWGGRWITRPDGAKIICSWLGHYNADEQVSYSLGRYELVKDGKLLETEFEEFNLRFYTQAEFTHMLEEAGFTSIQMFKTYERTAPGAEDDTIIFECAKP